MPRAFGLPGNTGRKAHEAFMAGHIAASNGKERRVPLWAKSKACTKAYNRGYDLGIEQKEGRVKENPMITRHDIMQDYDVENDIIYTPGMFESEFIWSPYWYELTMMGDGEVIDEGVTLLEITDEDRDEWPELDGDSTHIAVAVSDQGFVSIHELDEEEAEDVAENGWWEGGDIEN